MQFVDEATIEVTGGKGGDGIVSFRRESHVPLGGPDGGDGGKGGNVILRATSAVVTLLDHRYRRIYIGAKGARGGPKNMSGRGGEDTVIPVPIGTIVINTETEAVLADLSCDGVELIVAQGGRGGQGNARFKTATRKVPRFSQSGEEPEMATLKLNLKLVAEVGLIGLPNAGKSTFLRGITASQARVGAYPFTTLVPNLGVYRLGDRDVVVADIPGLIEGASKGQGLGDRFLKHIERTKVLVHLLSLSPDSIDPLEAYRVVNHELAEHSAELAKRPQIVLLNKIDVLEDREELALWREEFAALGVTVMAASGLTRENVGDVMIASIKHLDDLAEGAIEVTPWSPV